MADTQALDAFVDARVVEVYVDAKDEWRWRRMMRRGARVVADGAEGYTTRAGALKAARRENPGIEVVG